MTDLENPAAIVLVGEKGRQVYEAMRYGKQPHYEYENFDSRAFEEYWLAHYDPTVVIPPKENWDKDDD